jgi:hypothetical protein
MIHRSKPTQASPPTRFTSLVNDELTDLTDITIGVDTLPNDYDDPHPILPHDLAQRQQHRTSEQR